ncbi:MAG: hypothetical protein GWM90_16295, partial [Gemmatimonadetes bacterium]|nr:hypothetical protein [Gemmatimonadota bacterium]NIX45603.1 hypothetical protein [Gemmatimonadota bacterium]
MESSGPKWEKVDALLDRVLEIDQEERHSFLDRLPPAEVDPEVVAQVRRMLPVLNTGSGP